MKCRAYGIRHKRLFFAVIIVSVVSGAFVGLRIRNARLLKSEATVSVEYCDTVARVCSDISRGERLSAAKEIAQRCDRKTADIYGEIELHNILYRLGYKREQTAVADIDYDGDARWYVRFASRVIWWTYGGEK